MQTTEITIAVTNGHPTTNSIHVAEKFSKKHFHVIRDIENLECSPEFRKSNFGLTPYLDEQGKPRKAYTITRDGFTFLAMGFTGKEAAIWKEKYIAAFNAMEETLKRQSAQAALASSKTLVFASRQFHTTANAFRKDHGLRRAYQMANAEVQAGSGLDLLSIWQIDLNDVAEAATPKKRKEDRILDCIGNADRYAGDKAYGKLCKAGFMPFGKLNSLTKTKAKDLAASLRQLEAEGLIVEIDDERTGFVQCYVLAGGAA